MNTPRFRGIGLPKVDLLQLGGLRRDEEAFLDEHYRSRAFADYQAGIGEHLVRSSELSVHVVQESAMLVDRSPLDIAQDD